MNKLKCTSVAQCNALKDTFEVCSTWGDIVKIYLRGESDVTRGAYTDIDYSKVEPDVVPLSMPAHPIMFQPTRRLLEKAGMREDCDVLITTPMYSWNINNIDFEDIDTIRTTVILRGQKYVIKEKSLESQFTDTFLYINLALKKK